MTIHLTYIVNRCKWQQKVHDISNFMVKYYYFFYHCITLYCWTFSYLHISSSKFFTMCKCISLNLCCSKKVLFRNLKFVSWYTNFLSAPKPHDGSNWSLFISVLFPFVLFWPGFQSLTLKLQPLHILIGSAALGSELIGQIAGGCGSA